jgi:FixJ family two-component response regulator
VTKPRPIVAIVDDDPRMLESLEDLLEASGYAARTYGSAQALLGAGLEELDVLVADIGMPGIDGFQLHEASRALRPGLPVFLITGRHELMDDERVRRASGVFRKPFDAAELLRAIDEALPAGGIGGRNGN